MSNPIDLEAIARQAFGIPAAHETLLDRIDALVAERTAWAQQCQRAEAEVADLLERNKALQARVDVLGEFCRNTPEMREIVGELREINKRLNLGLDSGHAKLTDLLRRLDRESQEETQQ